MGLIIFLTDFFVKTLSTREVSHKPWQSLTAVSRKTSIFQEDGAGKEPFSGSLPTENSSAGRLRCLANYIAQQTPRPGIDAGAVHSGIGSSRSLMGKYSPVLGTRLPSLPRGQGGCISATRKKERWRLLGDVEAALGRSESEW